MTAKESIGLSLLISTPLGVVGFIVWISHAQLRNVPLIIATMPLLTLSIAALVVCASVWLGTGLTWEAVFDFLGRSTPEGVTG